MAFISEIHYQDSFANSTGVAEYIEVSLTAAEAARASDFDIATYNFDGVAGATVNLGSLTPVFDPASNLYVYTFTTVTTDPDNPQVSSTEAIALTDATLSAPISFYDIGGGTSNIQAIGGTAAGFTSSNIPASPSGSSIQFDVDGNRTDGALTQGTALCIANGAWIETPTGPVLIEDLRVGDMVVTKDDGPKPLRWVYSSILDPQNLRRNPALAPVCISAGALGQNCPSEDLRVSPQHQILVDSTYASLLWDSSTCLVKAKDLVTYNDRVTRDGTDVDVEYFHLLFDDHQIIFANGAPTESFHPGPEAMIALDPEQRAELSALFPNLSNTQSLTYRTLKQWEAAVIL